MSVRPPILLRILESLTRSTTVPGDPVPGFLSYHFFSDFPENEGVVSPVFFGLPGSQRVHLRPTSDLPD